ncbi:MAG: TetR/AcrR family transcriptional regulator [Sandaracinaceae bacterium]|nr:TetR/AcrR family transcriptional regulator [Myxococcales bacterium]MCB9657460.1 TetR/AcrR family transcriptional regulator [Sandaracinaceae bacterium]
MARPQQFDSEALLESMRDTFLDLGPGASTQELAKRAGVSEGTLYKRFGSKLRMFIFALRLPQIEECEWFTSIPERVGKGSIEEHLAHIALGMHSYVSELMPCSQMIAANGKLEPKDFAKLLGKGEKAPPFMSIDAMTSYFQGEMKLGRVRACDPGGLARLFIGAVIHDVNLRLHFPDQVPSSPPTVARLIAETVARLATVPEAQQPTQTPARRARRPRD